MDFAQAVKILSGKKSVEQNLNSGPVTTQVISGRVVSKSTDGQVKIEMDGSVYSADDSQYITVDTVGGLEEGDEVTLLLSGHYGYGMTPFALGSPGSVDRIVTNVEVVKEKVTEIYADYVKASLLQADVAELGFLTANSATITDLAADTAKIHSLTAEELSASTAYISALETGNITAATIIADNATLAQLDVESVNADVAKIHNLTAEELSASTAYIAALTTGNVTAANIIADKAKLAQLDADSINADVAKIHNLTAEELSASTAYISALTAGSVTAANIIADKAKLAQLDVNNINADHAVITNLDSNYAHLTQGVIDNATIGHANVDGLYANYAHISQGKIDNATIDLANINDLYANYAHISNGIIDNATIDFAKVNNLAANYAQINLANVNNAWITNGTIKDAAISDAQIIGVSANKLTAGTIDASNINVANLRADSLIVNKINGQPILGGYVAVDSTASGYSSKNPKTQGWYEIQNGSMVATNDTTVNASKAYYTTSTSIALYDQTYIDGLETTLNNRIDGAIETFSGTVVPTLTNYPYTDWYDTTTSPVTDNRAEHVGDIYYVVNEQSQQDGYCYRFTYDNTTSSYSWVLIKDSDVTAALSDITDLQTFQSNTTSWMNETDEGLVTIRQNHTSLSGVVDKTVKASTQLWFTKANETAPSAPNAQVTSTATTGNAWTTVVPVYNIAYPYYFYCWQYKLVDNTYTWSAVINDKATAEAQERARTGVTNAATAQSTANANIKSSVQLWMTKANDTTPNKPNSVVSSTATSANTWTTVVPVYSSTYPYYFYCYQQQKGDGTYQWTDVVYDQATSEAMKKAQEALPSSTFTTFQSTTFKEVTDTVNEQTTAITTLTETTTGLRNDFDGLEIGGRNLLEQSWMSSSFTANGITFTNHGDGSFSVSGTTNSSAAWFAFADRYKLQEKMADGGTFTLSCDKASYNSNTFNLSVAYTEPNSSTAKYITNTSTIPSGCTITAVNLYIPANTTVTSISHGHIKLERGVKATDWSPAPEDMATSESVTTLSNTVNTVSQTANSNSSKIERVTETVNSIGVSVIDLANMDIWEQGTTSNEAVGKTYDQMKGSSSGRIRFKELMPIRPGEYIIEKQHGEYWLFAFDANKQLIDWGGAWISANSYTCTIPNNCCFFMIGACKASRTDGVATSPSDAPYIGLSIKYDYAKQSSFSTLSNDYSTFKQSVESFESTVGTTYATKNELSSVGGFKVLNGTYTTTRDSAVSWATEGSEGGWNVDSTSGIRVGDTVYIKILTTDNDSKPIYVIGTVTSIVSATRIGIITHGYIDGNITQRVGSAETSITQNANDIALRATKTEAYQMGQPNLSPWYESQPFAAPPANPYWNYFTLATTLDVTTTYMGNGWMRYQASNTSNNTKIRAVAVQKTPAVKPGQNYTWLIELRNCVKTGDNRVYFYMNSVNNAQFYGTNYVKRLNTNTGTSPLDISIYSNWSSIEFRVVKTSSTVDDGHWDNNQESSVLYLAGFGLWVESNCSIDFEVRVSVYEGEYTGPYKPYSGSQLYASQAELIVANDSISTKVEKNGVISSINQSAESVTIDASKVNIAGATLFTSGRLSESSLNNAYDAKGSASTVQTNLDNMQIGGENLIPMSHRLSKFNVEDVNHIEVFKTKDWIQLKGKTTQTSSYTIFYDVDAKASTEYTVSFDVLEVTDVSNTKLFYSKNQGFASSVYLNSPYLKTHSVGDATRYSLTFTTDSNTTSLRIGFGVRTVDHILKLRNVKLELGNTATAWTPAPSDAIGPKLLTTSYSYNQTQVEGYAAEGHDDYWWCSNGSDVNVGDSIYLRITNSTTNSYVHILGRVYHIGERTVSTSDQLAQQHAATIFIISRGLIDTTAGSRANLAAQEEQYIYISKADGTTSVSAKTDAWVTKEDYQAGVWTRKRPSYDSSYPVLFVAKQRKNTLGTITCSTPIIDDTTTIIDGGKIITNSITADKLSASSINASSMLTVGAFTSAAASSISNSEVYNSQNGFTILWNPWKNQYGGGEALICKLDPATKTVDDSSNGTVMWNGKLRTVARQEINPNDVYPYNIPLFVVLRLSSADATTGTNYLVYYDSSASAWKGGPIQNNAIASWTWNDATDMILGSFVEPGNEYYFTETVVYDPPKTYPAVTSASATLSGVKALAESANSIANAAAPKTDAVKRTQRIYYQSNSTTAPSTPGTASSNWVTDTSGSANRWTLKRMSYASATPYIWTCEQKETVSGTVSYTSVLLDDTTTVIDGGKIITGSVAANAISASSGTFDTANIPNLSAAKITSGDIAAARIKANVISAINSLTAGTINAARIDASNLTIGASQVTGLEIGGRNLLEQSWMSSSFTANGITFTNHGDGSFSVSGTATASFTIAKFYVSANNGTGLIEKMASGGTFTLSCDKASYNESNFNISVAYTEPNSSAGKYLTTTGTLPAGCTINQVSLWITSGNTVTSVSHGHIKLERGVKATDWSPAPEDTNAAIADISIGGRNLIRNSKNLSSFVKESTAAIQISADSDKAVYTRLSYRSGQSWYVYYYDIPVVGSTTYTISFTVLATSSISKWKLWYGNTSWSKSGYLTELCSSKAVSGGTRYWLTTTTDSGQTVIRFGPAARDEGDTITICDVKCEAGNKPTDWSPAPSDVSNGIASAAQTATNYLTVADSTGLMVHPNGVANTGVKITSAVDIMQSGVSVANYGATARVGKTGQSYATVESTGFSVYNNAGNTSVVKLKQSTYSSYDFGELEFLNKNGGRISSTNGNKFASIMFRAKDAGQGGTGLDLIVSNTDTSKNAQLWLDADNQLITVCGALRLLSGSNGGSNIVGIYAGSTTATLSNGNWASLASKSTLEDKLGSGVTNTNTIIIAQNGDCNAVGNYAFSGAITNDGAARGYIYPSISGPVRWNWIAIRFSN